MRSFFSSLIRLALITSVVAGCATQAPLTDSAPGQELATGRFALRASFLGEASQGRFEWRVDALGDPASAQQVLIQDPWGQLQGIFSWQPQATGPWAGWSLRDANGRPLLPRQGGLQNTANAAHTNGRDNSNTAEVTPVALEALAAMLHGLRETLESKRAGLGNPANADAPASAFTLRHAAGAEWIEIRMVVDPGLAHR